MRKLGFAKSESQTARPWQLVLLHAMDGRIEGGGNSEAIQDRRGDFRIVCISVAESNCHRSSGQFFSTVEAGNKPRPG